MKRHHWFVLAFAISAAIGPLSFAQDNSYTSPTDGFWDEARLWSLAVPPSISQSGIFITNAASVNVTIDSITTSEFLDTLTISNLSINPQGNSSAVYLDNTGTVALHVLGGMTIGPSPAQPPIGVGSFISSNSTLIVDGLLGGQLLDNGTMIIAGGSLIAPNVDFLVGFGEDNYQTSLLLSNATVQVGILEVARGTEGPDAVVEVFGGVTTLSGPLIVGESTFGGTANMTVDGGALLVVTNGATGIGAGFQSRGQMTISNATFLATTIYLPGNRGFADLFINNGTVTLSGDLEIGTGGQGSGAVGLSGGALIVTNGEVDIGTGDPSDGNSLNINGLFLARDVYVVDTFDTSGSFNIGGGTSVLTSNLFVGYAAEGSALLFGGQLIVTNAPIIVDFDSSFAVSGGQLISQTIILGQSSDREATLSISGGSVTVSGGITLGDCDNFVVGFLPVNGGQLIVTNSSHTAFVDVQNGQLSISSGTAQVDTLVMTNTCSGLVHTGGTLIVGSVILDPNAFRIVSVTRQSNDVLVSWLMAPGATNALQASNASSYSTNNFSDIFIVTNNTATGVLTNFLDLGAATNKSRFYRARLSP